ncbi:MAG: ABC transporter permease [Peptococcaceae bacterium]|jgi:peptide/nickel transport system permease protein|nr:ABC transporter permease [Peptococcaceae bacterium]MDH7524457.1 ABC transporter permease [Peptococcaceae bacterium]
MLRYTINRLLMMILVVLGVLLFVFILGRASGDPVPALLGGTYTQEQYDAMYKELGLDDPYPVQYFKYVKGIVTQFDLGRSYESKREVREEVANRLPISLRIALFSLLWSIPFGVLCGLISAVRQYSVADVSLTTAAMLLASIPNFWAGLMLMLLFSLVLKWLPATGLDSWLGYIMPCIALGLRPVASFTRMTRSTMLEVIRQDYIRTARSKGLRERKVIIGHALQNAAIPIVTLMGTTFEVIVGSSAVIESVFNIPGLGSYMIYSIGVGDYPAVQGAVLVFSLLVCVLNFLTDIVYAFIDPRIKEKYESASAKARRANRNMIKVARGQAS